MKTLRHSSLILAAMAMSSGASVATSGNSMALNAATAASQHAATKINVRNKAALPSHILNEGKRYGIFKHFTLNQRQRRKFNRQRHAAGYRKAFA